MMKNQKDGPDKARSCLDELGQNTKMAPIKGGEECEKQMVKEKIARKTLERDSCNISPLN